MLGNKWDWLFVTAYLLSPEAMKCEISTLREQFLHPWDMYSTELQGAATVVLLFLLVLVFCWFVCFVLFLMTTFSILIMSSFEDFFRYFQALFCSFAGRWLVIATGKGMEIYSGIDSRSANVKKEVEESKCKNNPKESSHGNKFTVLCILQTPSCVVIPPWIWYGSISCFLSSCVADKNL